MVGCRTKDMLPLEQVLCMIWLAKNCDLKDLRCRQSLIRQQQERAYKRNLSDSVHDELGMMADNTAAAVAYQTFGIDEGFWLAFIQTG